MKNATLVVFALTSLALTQAGLALPPDYSTHLPVAEVPAEIFKPKMSFLSFGKPAEPARPALVPLSTMMEKSKRTRNRYAKQDPRSPYPPHYKVFVRRDILAQSGGGNTRVIIDLNGQRVYLLVNEIIALEAPVSSARTGKVTPTGNFQITERIRSGKVSNLYHVLMPYWQRLNQTEFGIHAGYLPGRPASAGCVRMPNEAAEIIFNHCAYGTRVTITNSWL